MTDQRDRTAPGSDDTRGEASSPAERGGGNTLLKWSAACLAAVAVAAGFATGAVGPLLTFAVLVPGVVAALLALAGREGPSRVARILAVAGGVLWLAVTGGLAMLIVVSTCDRDDLPPRARPLRRSTPCRHEGHRVLPRLRDQALVVPPW
ncbi:MAG: hypothetical protein R2716_06535 [Microthrixaceae bacterium]